MIPYSSAPARRWESQPILTFGLILFALLCTYAAVLILPYAVNDDYAVLAVIRQTGELDSLRYLYGMGRPIQAVFAAGISLLAQQVDNLRFAHLLGVVGAALLACYLYRLLRRAGWNTVLAICLPIIIATLPPFQITIAAHTTMQMERPAAALLAGFAFPLMLRAFDSSSRLKQLACVTAATVLVTLVMFTYQPDAMFFWVTAAIVLFTPGAALLPTAKRLALGAVVMGISLGLGYVGFKLLTLGVSSVNPRTGVVTDPIGKLAWFVREPLNMSLNFYNIDVRLWIAEIVLGVVIAGLWFNFKAPPKTRLGLLGLALVLIPASFAANLLVAVNQGPYRTLPALSALCAIYLFMGLRGVAARTGTHGARAATGAALLVTVVGLFVAFYTVTFYVAIPQNAELESMREQLASQSHTQAGQVYFFQAARDKTSAPRIFSDFGQSSTCRPWVPANAMYLLMSERAPLLAELPVNIVPAPESALPPADAIVIDMRTLHSNPVPR